MPPLQLVSPEAEGGKKEEAGFASAALAKFWSFLLFLLFRVVVHPNIGYYPQFLVVYTMASVSVGSCL